MNNNQKFLFACTNGRIEDANNLLEYKQIDIHYENDLIFVSCLVNNRLHVVDWLYMKDKEYYNNLIKEKGIKYCKYIIDNYQLNGVEWLLSLKLFDVRANDDLLFFKYCRLRTLESREFAVMVAKYLMDKCKDYIVIFNEDETDILETYVKNIKLKYVDHTTNYISNKFLNENVEDCPICMSNRVLNVKFDCKHMFCGECVMNMMANEWNCKCPLCKNEVNKERVLYIKSE